MGRPLHLVINMGWINPWFEEGLFIETVHASFHHLPQFQPCLLLCREDRNHRVMTPVTNTHTHRISDSGYFIPLLYIFSPLLLAGSSPFLSFYLNILIMVMFIKRALTFWRYIMKYLWFEWQGAWDLLQHSPVSGEQQAETNEAIVALSL